MLLLTIFSFVLYSIACAIAGACLLRVLLQAQRIGFSHHPLGQLLLALTDWLVRPARRVLRPQGRWDWLTLLLAYAVLLAHWLLMWLLQQLLAGGLLPWSLFALAPLQALFSLLRLGLYLALTLLVLYVALFWAQPRGHWLHHLSELLCTPWLAPLRRLLPTAGGIDFSPMALGLLLAIALMVLRWLEFSIIAPALFSQPLPRLAIPFG
ncbi:YggT family protein [Vandammella animalimorsus]|nr:YggT family protein [Vandammella animalimorsus]